MKTLSLFAALAVLTISGRVCADEAADQRAKDAVATAMVAAKQATEAALAATQAVKDAQRISDAQKALDIKDAGSADFQAWRNARDLEQYRAFKLDQCNKLGGVEGARCRAGLVAK